MSEASSVMLLEHDRRLDKIENELGRLSDHERRLSEIEGDLFANSKRGTNSLATRQSAVEMALSILSAQVEQVDASVKEMITALQAQAARKETVLPMVPVATSAADSLLYRLVALLAVALVVAIIAIVVLLGLLGGVRV